jgi:hypothetical protein
MVFLSLFPSICGYVPWREVGLGLRELLAPGLALLDRLLLWGWGASDRDAATNRVAKQAGLVVTGRCHALGGVERVLGREERGIEGAGRGDEAVGEGVRGRVLELDVWSGRHGGGGGGGESGRWLICSTLLNSTHATQI